MKKSREMSTVEMFLAGIAFAKVKNPERAKEFAKKVANVKGEVILDESNIAMNNFDNGEMVAVFDKQSNQIKLASREFFDFVYLQQPQTCINKYKSFWFDA